MAEPISESALDQLFRDARTCQWFDGREVTDAQIAAIWDLLKIGPTSMNQLPLRVVWCKSPEAKERLAAHAAPGNKDKVRQAPVCAILASDTRFHEYMPQLFPVSDVKPLFDGVEKTAMRETSAFRNATLQGGYFILAARALGLDCGPMSGFDNAGVDAEFFGDTPSWQSNFICSVGYGDMSRVHPRLPRPEFPLFNRLL
jgi:3-hydroxypropanoate dehydrogenase